MKDIIICDLEEYLDDNHKFDLFDKEKIINGFLDKYLILLEKYDIENTSYKKIYKSCRRAYLKQVLNKRKPRIICLVNTSLNMFEKINTDIKQNINLELELVSSDDLFLDKLKNSEYDIIIMNKKNESLLLNSQFSDSLIMKYDYDRIQVDLNNESGYLLLGSNVNINYCFNGREKEENFKVVNDKIGDSNYLNSYYKNKKRVLIAVIHSAINSYLKENGIKKELYKTTSSYTLEYDKKTSKELKELEKSLRAIQLYKNIEKVVQEYLFYLNGGFIHEVPHNIRISEEYNSIHVDILKDAHTLSSIVMFYDSLSSDDFKRFKIIYRKDNSKKIIPQMYCINLSSLKNSDCLLKSPDNETIKEMEFIYKSCRESLERITDNGKNKYLNDSKLYKKKISS